MKKAPDYSPKARLKSFTHAFRGIWLLVRYTPNAAIHLVLTIVVIAGGFWYGVSITEWCLLLIAMGAVWAAEAINTALEYLTDKVSPEFHPLAGKAKDTAAGGVLLMAIFAAAVGVIIFWPKVFGG